MKDAADVSVAYLGSEEGKLGVKRAENVKCVRDTFGNNVYK